jgi:hypothetical protein
MSLDLGFRLVDQLRYPVEHSRTVCARELLDQTPLWRLFMSRAAYPHVRPHNPLWHSLDQASTILYRPFSDGAVHSGLDLHC